MTNELRVILNGSLLAFCSLDDIRYKKIKVFYPLIWGCAGCLIHMASGNYFLFLSGCLPGITLLALSWITGGAIGAGDGLIVAVMGMLDGFQKSLLVLFWAMAGVSIMGGVMIAAGRWGRKKKVPFVPFLLTAYVGVMLWN